MIRRAASPPSPPSCEKLKSPDIVALQEIQDDNGTTDDGVTLSEATLQKLVAAIELAGGPKYSYTYVAPENNEDGGQPGANIRQVFLYNASRVQLADFVPTIGDYDDANAVVSSGGSVDLAYTVGRLIQRMRRSRTPVSRSRRSSCSTGRRSSS